MKTENRKEGIIYDFFFHFYWNIRKYFTVRMKFALWLVLPANKEWCSLFIGNQSQT